VAGDDKLWRQAVRDVAPLPGRPAPRASAPAPDRPAAKGSRPPPPLDPRNARPGGPPSGDFAGLDRANAERLKRGRHPIEAQLDLHGMAQGEAHRALARFVAGSREAGRRCVLVITGRGLGPSGSGVLKQSVPRWLAEPDLRRHILAIASAQPRDGGAGALYVLLRRRR
jgi:DNA-nicking Smr family endonuclease